MTILLQSANPGDFIVPHSRFRSAETPIIRTPVAILNNADMVDLRAHLQANHSELSQATQSIWDELKQGNYSRAVPLNGPISWWLHPIRTLRTYLGIRRALNLETPVFGASTESLTKKVEGKINLIDPATKKALLEQLKPGGTLEPLKSNDLNKSTYQQLLADLKGESTKVTFLKALLQAGIVFERDNYQLATSYVYPEILDIIAKDDVEALPDEAKLSLYAGLHDQDRHFECAKAFSGYLKTLPVEQQQKIRDAIGKNDSDLTGRNPTGAHLLSLVDAAAARQAGEASPTTNAERVVGNSWLQPDVAATQLPSDEQEQLNQLLEQQGVLAELSDEDKAVLRAGNVQDIVSVITQFLTQQVESEADIERTVVDALPPAVRAGYSSQQVERHARIVLALTSDEDLTAAIHAAPDDLNRLSEDSSKALSLALGLLVGHPHTKNDLSKFDRWELQAAQAKLQEILDGRKNTRWQQHEVSSEGTPGASGTSSSRVGNPYNPYDNYLPGSVAGGPAWDEDVDEQPYNGSSESTGAASWPDVGAGNGLPEEDFSSWYTAPAQATPPLSLEAPISQARFREIQDMKLLVASELSEDGHALYKALPRDFRTALLQSLQRENCTYQQLLDVMTQLETELAHINKRELLEYNAERLKQVEEILQQQGVPVEMVSDYLIQSRQSARTVEQTNMMHLPNGIELPAKTWKDLTTWLDALEAQKCPLSPLLLTNVQTLSSWIAGDGGSDSRFQVWKAVTALPDGLEAQANQIPPTLELQTQGGAAITSTDTAKALRDYAKRLRAAILNAQR